jgi:hypothetical protein
MPRDIVRRAMSYKSKYTQPLMINKYDISPIREVPAHIIRPPYVTANP